LTYFELLRNLVLPGKAVADMVLPTGNCLVEESLLSGEVTSVTCSNLLSHLI